MEEKKGHSYIMGRISFLTRNAYRQRQSICFRVLFFLLVLVGDSLLYRTLLYPLVWVTWFCDHMLFAVGALFVWRRKVCSLIVRFLPSRCWHLDIRPGDTPNICKLSFLIAYLYCFLLWLRQLFRFESIALYFAISAVPWQFNQVQFNSIKFIVNTWGMVTQLPEPEAHV